MVTSMYPTERLYLRTAEDIDVEDVLDYIRDNKNHLYAFEPERNRSYYTYREQSLSLAFDLKHLKDKTGLKLFITKKTHRQIIGILNFSNIIMGAFKSCNVGYSLDHRYLKQGFMTEALRKGIEIIFSEYGLHRIEGNVMPNNEASSQILIKLGFEEEGRAKKYLEINGIWEDHIHYTILNEA